MLGSDLRRATVLRKCSKKTDSDDIGIVQLMTVFMDETRLKCSVQIRSTCIAVMSGNSFFFKQKTAYEIGVRLVGSEMCIRDRCVCE